MGYLTSTLIAALLLSPLLAQADELIRKGGEWRTIVTGVGDQPKTIEMCFAPSTAEQAMARLAARPNCTKKDIKRDGNVVTLDVACGAWAMEGTATFSGDDAYMSDLTMHFSASGSAKIVHTISEAKRIGDCKPGETPR